MNYNVHVAPIIDGEIIGVEIQPPLSDKAFDGIRAMLVHELHGPLAPSAATVELTRNDVEGTAFVFGKARNGAGEAYTSPIGMEDIGKRVASLIDPTDLHGVWVHYPTSS